MWTICRCLRGHPAEASAGQPRAGGSVRKGCPVIGGYGESVPPYEPPVRTPRTNGVRTSTNPPYERGRKLRSGPRSYGGSGGTDYSVRSGRSFVPSRTAAHHRTPNLIRPPRPEHARQVASARVNGRGLTPRPSHLPQGVVGLTTHVTAYPAASIAVAVGMRTSHIMRASIWSFRAPPRDPPTGPSGEGCNGLTCGFTGRGAGSGTPTGSPAAPTR